MSKLIVEAITEYYGERCPDYDEGCFCCKVWKEYDALIAPARCDELNTVAYQYKFRDVWLVSDAPKVMRKDDYELRELVTRQNAEEVIAAKDARIAELEADNKRLREALEIIDDHALRCAKLVKSDPCAHAYVKNILDEARAALEEVKP